MVDLQYSIYFPWKFTESDYYSSLFSVKLILDILIALATIPSRRYRSLAAAVPSSLPVPSRLDGTVADEATVPTLSVTRLVLTPALTLNDPLHPKSTTAQNN